jgi:hypothetical protein
MVKLWPNVVTVWNGDAWSGTRRYYARYHQVLNLEHANHRIFAESICVALLKSNSLKVLIAADTLPAAAFRRRAGRTRPSPSPVELPDSRCACAARVPQFGQRGVPDLGSFSMLSS